MRAYLNLNQGSTSTSSRQHLSMQGPKWHNLKSQLLLLNMSSIGTETQLMIRRTTFFAMSHSNQLEELTFPWLLHCCWFIYMCEIAVRAGDSRGGHGGLR